MKRRINKFLIITNILFIIIFNIIFTNCQQNLNENENIEKKESNNENEKEEEEEIISFFSNEFIIRLIGGGIGGLLEVLITYPLFLVMTKHMMSNSIEKGIIQTIKNITHQKSWKGLYQGITLPLICAVPWRAVKLTGLQTLKPIFGVFLTCIITGIIEALICNPFEVIRIQLIELNQTRVTLDIESNETTQKIFKISDIFRLIRESNGISFLWNFKQIIILAFRQAVFNFGNFYTYLMMNYIISNYFSFIPFLLSRLISGYVAGLAGVCLNNPIDVLKTRVQQKQNENKSFIELIQEGGLYRGLKAKLIRVGFSSSIMYVVYNSFSRF